MPVPQPTPILRLIHIDNLATCLARGGCHAPNHIPADGRPWRGIHDVEVQQKRGRRPVPCGPGGCALDYVPFYFGYMSPMLLRLKTGNVAGYAEGQEPLAYLVSSAQAVRDSGTGFVFTDGHALAAYTDWYSDLRDLDAVDWDAVYKRYWSGSAENDMDLPRKKQAEFLVFRFCDWSLIHEIAVIDANAKAAVDAILARAHPRLRRVVHVRRNWYY